MNRAAFKAALTLAVCLAFVTPVSAAQQVPISSGIGGANILPRFAVDARNGNVFVVWMNIDQEQGTTDIWGRMARRKSAGYSLKKPVKISGETSYNANPDVVFSAQHNEFLVVWDTAPTSGLLVSSPLLARVVNARGKVKSDVFTLLDNGFRNQIPLLAAVEVSGTAPANHAGLLRFVTTSYPTPDQPDGCLTYGILDDQYQVQTETQRYALPIALQPLGSGTPTLNDCSRLVDPTDILSTPMADDRFRVQVNWHGFERQEDGNFSQDSGMFWFFDENNLDAVVKVLDSNVYNGQSRFWVFAAGLTNVEFTVTVTDSGAEHTLYDTPYKTPFNPVVDTDAFATCPYPVVRRNNRSITARQPSPAAVGVQTSDIIHYGYVARAPLPVMPSAKIRIGQVVYAVNDTVMVQNLLVNSHGKLKLAKKANPLFTYPGTLNALRAAWHSPTNTRLVVWGKFLSVSDQQIWLHVS